MPSRRVEHLQQGGRDRLGPLARHEVPNTRDHAAGDQRREGTPLSRRRLARRRSDAVFRTVQRDRRRLDLRALGQLCFHVSEPRLTGRVGIAVTIGMDHHVHEVRIVERRRCASEHVVGEAPRVLIRTERGSA